MSAPQGDIAEPAWRKIAIIAGGGDLPIALAESCRAQGRECVVIRLDGFAEDALERYDGAPCGLAEVGKLFSLLKDYRCDAVTLAGIVTRPNFAAIRPDWRGAKLLPKVLKAAASGDDALLSTLVAEFEAEGLAVIGADALMGELTAPAGLIAGPAPRASDLADMGKAARLVAALDPFDVGQGAIVCGGLVLAVEAAEGTDAMLARCAGLRQELRGTAAHRRGVLVKRPKPGQERRVDLPVIGEKTIDLVAAAGLSGVAVEAGAALILGFEAVVRAAKGHNIFVYGFEDGEIAEPPAAMDGDG